METKNEIKKIAEDNGLDVISFSVYLKEQFLEDNPNSTDSDFLAWIERLTLSDIENYAARMASVLKDKVAASAKREDELQLQKEWVEVCWADYLSSIDAEEYEVKPSAFGFKEFLIEKLQEEITELEK